MTAPLAFVSAAFPGRLLSPHGSRAATCSRRHRVAACASGDKGSEGKEGAEPSALPPGTSSSQAGKKVDLGFVGAKRIGISFVCTADDCNTRISKTVGRRSYETGTVIIQCPGCYKHHVIADNKGMYSDLTGGSINIEQIAKAKGQKVTRVDDSVFNLESLFSELSTDKETTVKNDVEVTESAPESSDSDEDNEPK